MTRRIRLTAAQGLLLLALILLISQPGCVRRRMTIHSNPAGAVAYVDNQHVGITPVSVPFTYYGTREIRLERDGFETVNEKHRFSVPWYQWPPLDFITENLWPFQIRDERILSFEMAPQPIVPVDQLLSRADNLRISAQQGIATPLPGQPLGPSLPPPARTMDVGRPATLPSQGIVLEGPESAAETLPDGLGPPPMAPRP